MDVLRVLRRLPENFFFGPAPQIALTIQPHVLTPEDFRHNTAPAHRENAVRTPLLDAGEIYGY
jgi:hypothetical protein